MYQPLHEINDIEMNNTSQPKPPPPITIYKVNNIIPLQDLLNKLVNTRYQITTLGLNKIKLQLRKKEDLVTVTQALDQNKTEYHTYKNKEDKTYRVVLRGLHSSSNTDHIKAELIKLGHETTNIWNIRHRTTKEPLPMFYLDLKAKENNKQIYDIKQISCCKVYFEPPHAKRTIPQCTNCQDYMHTKNFCHKSPRCVKCTKSHLSSECPRKVKDNGVRCANCNGNHPANYRGCIIHKQLQEKLYPQLRRKTNDPIQSIQRTATQTTPQQLTNTRPNSDSANINPSTNSTTYTEKNTNSPNENPNTIIQLPRKTWPNTNSQNTNLPTENHPNPTEDNTSSPNKPNDDINELKSLIKELIEQNRENSRQMGTMLNLLTSLVNKISNGPTP